MKSGSIRSSAMKSMLFLILLCNYAKAQESFSYLKNNMIMVEGGTFTMGEKEDRDSICTRVERPAHQVTVSSFYIDKYDVTVKEFEVFAKETGYKTDAEKGAGSSILKDTAWSRDSIINWRDNARGYPLYDNEKNNPVIHISLNDANEYCRWLTHKTGQTYRLPTEAEWEFAARGGNKSKGYKYAGSNSLDSVAWYIRNSHDKTHPVGQKKPNELGLYDMSGNVWQWCADRFDVSFYLLSPEKDPTGPIIGRFYVCRGGSFLHFANDCRIAMRTGREAWHQSSRHGFRVVRDL